MPLLTRLRLVAINDVYDLKNLPKLQTFLSKLRPAASAVLLAGDFISPSTLSAIDGGRGMVDSLRAAGITHACLGNHEADLKLASLKDRVSEFSKSVTLVNTNLRNPPPSASWLQSPMTPPYSIITTPCQRVKVALLGLLSDEEAMFRDGTFKGVPVANVIDSFSASYKGLVPELADMVVPMTHQSLCRDRDLANHMLEMSSGPGMGIIIGGHEHDPIDETVRHEIRQDCFVRILKTGCDATLASLVDLEFDVSITPPKLVGLSASFEDLSKFPDSPVVKNIVDTHLSIIEKMEHETIVDDTMLPPGTVLSSERSRYSQTTVGAFFCHAIKEELEADVAIINGASVAGGTTYEDNTLSYAQLKRELPFPTKMVVVSMTRAELQDAIDYSRTNIVEKSTNKEGRSTTDIPRRGYLQVDYAYDADPYSGVQSDELRVALPRNLLGGFCKIKPLMDVGARLKEENQFPNNDEFVAALDLVTRYCCKKRWTIVRDHFTFEELDIDQDGALDKFEVKKMMETLLGFEPEDHLVEDMIKSIDTDGNGVIDIGEFSHVLASIERQDWPKS